MDIALMSPLGLFMNAGLVAKCVMAFLLVASVWTWVLIVDGVVVLHRIKRSLASALTHGSTGVIWPIAEAVEKSRRLQLPGETSRQRRTRLQQQTNSAVQIFMTEAKEGLPTLAIVSSVGPFVGLFGTVWGIISSFASIAATQETSLTIVAPGIAEALAATAYGLAAAIPAAIAYNRIGASFETLDQKIRDYVKSNLLVGEI